MRILIAYSTKYGAATECATRIAAKIKCECDIVNLKTEAAPDITKYDKIIIGGSVYASNIQDEVKNFCNNNLEKLLAKPLGIFISSMGADQAMLESNFRFSFSAELMEHAIIADSLGGIFNFPKMKALERMVIKILCRSMKKKGLINAVPSGKEVVSTISEERIEIFADVMNKVK